MSFAASASVKLADDLVCITVTAPGAPETVLRLPRELAIDLAYQINRTASLAPRSYPTEHLKEATDG